MLVSAVLAVGGFVVSLQLKIGDLEAGAPELRADSRYNRDNAYISGNYSLSSDQFAVIVKTAAEGCLNYQTLVEADRLDQVAEAHRRLESNETAGKLILELPPH